MLRLLCDEVFTPSMTHLRYNWNRFSLRIRWTQGYEVDVAGEKGNVAEPYLLFVLNRRRIGNHEVPPRIDLLSPCSPLHSRKHTPLKADLAAPSHQISSCRVFLTWRIGRLESRVMLPFVASFPPWNLRALYLRLPHRAAQLVGNLCSPVLRFRPSNENVIYYVGLSVIRIAAILRVFEGNVTHSSGNNSIPWVLYVVGSSILYRCVLRGIRRTTMRKVFVRKCAIEVHL